MNTFNISRNRKSQVPSLAGIHAPLLLAVATLLLACAGCRSTTNIFIGGPETPKTLTIFNGTIYKSAGATGGTNDVHNEVGGPQLKASYK